MYLDVYFNLVEDDELDVDEFLEDVEKEIKKAEIKDILVIDGVIETDFNEYKNFYFEVFDFDIDFETKKDEVIELIKNEILKNIKKGF